MSKEQEIEEMMEEFKALPYEQLVASVVLMKSELIKAYELLDVLMLAVAQLIADQQKTGGVTHQYPGQYI